jgi:hypothetical protein
MGKRRAACILCIEYIREIHEMPEIMDAPAGNEIAFMVQA